MLNCTQCNSALIHFKTVAKSAEGIHLLAACTRCNAGFEVEMTLARPAKYSGAELVARKLECRRTVGEHCS